MRGRTRAGPGRKLASTQIITCVHTCAVAERRRSGSNNRSARNGSNTQFTAPASKPRAPNHHCPQEMADPPASAPRMCEHTRGSGAGISKSARLRSVTAPRMCERSLRVRFHLCGAVAGRTRDGDRWRLPHAVVRFHYGGTVADPPWLHFKR